MDVLSDRSEPSLTLSPDGPQPFRERADAWLGRCWQKGWLTRPELAPDRLISAATRSSGLIDFGGENGWRERLALLCQSLHTEASLSPLGSAIAWGQLSAALGNRLRAAEMWRQRPEILDVPIARPILIVGQMRSGSTQMQRLLASDPQLTSTRFFESWNPVPRWAHRGIDDRMLRGWLALRVARLLNPRFDVIHPSRTLAVDEEIGIHNIALYGSAFEAQWRIPSFARLGETEDSTLVYREFRRFLQTIRFLRREKGDKPWVMKLPQFGQDLKIVSQVFPEARLVVLERDPIEVVGSSASLVCNQMSVQSHDVDRRWIGQEWLAKTALREERISHGIAAHAGPVVTVRYKDMQSDWRQQIRRVYAALDLELTVAAEERMRRFMEHRRHDRLANHTYDLQHFGLTAGDVLTALGPAQVNCVRAAAA